MKLTTNAVLLTMENVDLPAESEEIVHCHNCTHRINKGIGLFVVCAGPCGMLFHISCVGLNKEHLQSLTKGVVWMCRDCSSCFRKWKQEFATESKTSDARSMHDEISALKCQVAGIWKSLSSINSSSSSADVPIHRSTPISSTRSSRLLDGTNISYVSHATGNDCNEVEDIEQQPLDRMCLGSSAPVGDQSFSLLLTNIDSSVSVNDVKAMVCQCAGVPSEDCNNVVRLVPRGVECSALDYVSFKIVLKKKWKCVAMCASTWPKGVKYREFINRKTNAWKPLQ